MTIISFILILFMKTLNFWGLVKALPKKIDMHIKYIWRKLPVFCPEECMDNTSYRLNFFFNSTKKKKKVSLNKGASPVAHFSTKPRFSLMTVVQYSIISLTFNRVGPIPFWSCLADLIEHYHSSVGQRSQF